jgi:hypothetical protein
MEYPMKIKTLVLGTPLAVGCSDCHRGRGVCRIVCNAYGDCWRTVRVYHYTPPGASPIYDDNWRWHARDNARYRWRDYHRGTMGRGGVWITF